MHLIFDFDGTIVDSFQCAIETYNSLAREHCFHTINDNETEHLRNLTSRELIKFLKIPFYKLPIIMRRARKLMTYEIRYLPSFPHLPETLQQLHDAGFSLGILTSNSKENVMTWLEHHDMQHLFQFIHDEAHYFGKKSQLNKIIKVHDIDRSAAFYFGDETRDIEAARKNGIYSVAVTWGFNSEKILSQHQPHYLVRKPEDIALLFL